MPTNHNNHSQSTASPIADDTSARTPTCPPELLRTTSYLSWTNPPSGPHILPGDGARSTTATPAAGSTVRSGVNRSRDGDGVSHHYSDPRGQASPDLTMKQMGASEEEPAAGRCSPDSDRSSCSGNETTPAAITPSTSSLLSYEFSNIRVGCELS